MTQEEKELLLKDICARLPYGVKVTDGIHIITLKPCSDTSIIIKNEHILPYLRPMSSMTEDEEDELKGWGDYELISWLDEEEVCFGDLSVKYETLVKLMDWLYRHHFDIHGLIKKGLALEAPKDMYK